MWQTLTFVFLIMGSMIGAGFASGKEILVFFGDFTILTPLSLIILFFVLFFSLFIFAKIGKHTNPKKIQDINKTIFLKGSGVMNIVIISCIVLLLSAMFAGADALGSQLLNSYNFPFIGVITVIIAVAIISFGFQTFKITNTILVIILFVLINLVAIMSLINPLNENIVFESLNFVNTSKAIFFPILYASMNMITESILAAITAVKLSKKQLSWAISLSSVLLVVSVFIVLFALTKNYSVAINASLPMLALAQLLGGVYPVLYGIILWVAIFTTILSCLYCAMEWLNKYIKNKFFSSLILATVSYLFGFLGFDLIVEYFYPIYGVAGAIFIAFATKYYFQNIYKKDRAYTKKF